MLMADRRHAKEDQREHGKDQRLDCTDQHFQQIKWNRHQESDQEGHRGQHNFTGEDVAKKPEGKGENTGNLANSFEDADKDVDALHKAMTTCIPELFEVTAP